MMGRQLLRSATAAAVGVLHWSVAWGCGDETGLTQVYAATHPTVVQIQTLGPGQGCSIFGSGFFITPYGNVMTAKHVVPEECQNQTILVRYEGNLEGIRMRVKVRSQRDIAILEPEAKPAAPIPYLEIDQTTPPGDMQDKQVLVLSFPEQYSRASYTAARVEAPGLRDDSNIWVLCGPAANPGRSGSAVVTAKGQAIAVFIERPRDGERAAQDVLRVIPIRVAVDLQLPERSSVAAAAGAAAAGSVLETGTLASKPGQLAYSYPVHFTTSDPPLPTESANRFLIRARDGKLEVRNASGLSMLDLLVAASDGWMTRYRSIADPAQLTFRAIPGYRFDPQSLRLAAESHNPREAEVPNRICQKDEEIDCFQVSSNGQQVTLRMRMYRGPVGDAARGWFHGELQSIQTRM